MTKRKLEDLNLLDDFLFSSVVNYPGIGEKFIRELLRVILGRNFGKLTVIPQKFYPGSDTDKHGARLDVYIEEDCIDNSEHDIRVYDIEPDKNIKDVTVLPQRVRFYHAKIDAHCLKSGESYQMLKKVMVILITPYDPFGLNRMIYTIRNKCEEVPSMPYDDGAHTFFSIPRAQKEIHRKNGSSFFAIWSILQREMPKMIIFGTYNKWLIL